MPLTYTLKPGALPSALSFSTLKIHSETQKWDVVDAKYFRPIVDVFLNNPSKPLTIIKGVKEQDLELAEDLFKMSQCTNVARAEFNLDLGSATDAATYNLVIFELTSNLHELTIGLVTKPINSFLIESQWIDGQHKLIQQLRTARSLNNKSPDESYSLTPHAFESVPMKAARYGTASSFVLSKASSMVASSMSVLI